MKMIHNYSQTLLLLILLFCSIAIDVDIRTANADIDPYAGLDVKYEDVVDTHKVQAGDTLITITRHYLGSTERWRENWKLNEKLKNPDLIYVGQWLTVIKQRKIIPEPVVAKKEVEAQNALITNVVNKVDKNIERSGWKQAQMGDRLYAEDGVRTLALSSAKLQFEQQASLILTEYSQLYLRDDTTEQQELVRSSVEIEKGSADLLLANGEPQTGGVEIIVGDARTVSMRSSDGIAKSRSKRDDNGRSQIMVYAGLAQVEANGITIEVPKGMGTTVEDGQPPQTPEKLLSQPKQVKPLRQARISTDSPLFIWERIDGSAYYKIEICEDVDCGALVRKTENITKTSYKAMDLPQGSMYWRVTAINRSGLQGFPSGAIEFELVEESFFSKYRLEIVVAVITLLLIVILLIRRKRKSQG